MATRCILILCLAVSDALIFFPRSYVRPPGIGGDVLPTAPKSRRSRSVQTMTYISMPKRLPSVSSGEIISFDLPGESAAAVQCIVEDVYEHSGGSSRTIHGRVSSLVHPEGDCLITCGIIDNERVSCLGNIRPDFMPHAQYELRPILNSTFHVLKEVLYSKYEDSDVDEEVQRGPRMSTKIREQHDAFAAKRLLTDTNQILDVMVVYTPDALTAIGSAEAVRLTVMLAIDESNKIFERSAIDLRLRLVHLTGMSNTAYADPSSLGTILTHATFYGGSNIAFDAEQSLRYTLQADALSVLTGESNSCGIAYMNGEGTADLQVSVTAYDCALGYYRYKE